MPHEIGLSNRRELLCRKDYNLGGAKYVSKKSLLALSRFHKKFPAALELHPSGGVHPSFFFYDCATQIHCLEVYKFI